jgi:hypothetical protein
MMVIEFGKKIKAFNSDLSKKLQFLKSQWAISRAHKVRGLKNDGSYSFVKKTNRNEYSVVNVQYMKRHFSR